MLRPTFYEFFAGGGMARAGLGGDWRCLFANDFDAKKQASYIANWGDAEFRLADIHALTAADLPGHADLAWASFPCQDLSLAGNGAGLKGARSGAFWGFHALMEGLRREVRAPSLLVLENVIGLLTANAGKDFATLCGALVDLGYHVGALTIDARHFSPQSRPRLFIVCHSGAPRSGEPSHDMKAAAGPWRNAALVRAVESLPSHVQAHWRWWPLPAPSASNIHFADVIEDNPPDVAWHTRTETARLISLMSDVNRAKVKEAQAWGTKIVGALYRRTRRDADGARIQRAEARFDGLAGCLRTPGGGSSRQFILVVEGKSVRSRLLSAREAARLMGLPDSYILPARYNDAYHLLGDGLAVGAVRFLADNLLRPLLEGGRKSAKAA